MGKFSNAWIDHRVSVILDGEEEMSFEEFTREIFINEITDYILEKVLKKCGVEDEEDLEEIAEDIKFIIDTVIKVSQDPDYSVEDAINELNQEAIKDNVKEGILESIEDLEFFDNIWDFVKYLTGEDLKEIEELPELIPEIRIN